MTAEQMFQNYKTFKFEISTLEFQIGQFQGGSEDDMILSISYKRPVGEERVQKNTHSDKTAAAAINYRKAMDRANEEWLHSMINRYRYVKEEIEFFEYSMSELNNVLSGVIMDLLDGELTWDNIAMHYHVSRTMVAKYKKAALKELNVRYEIRDRQTESYILN